MSRENNSLQRISVQRLLPPGERHIYGHRENLHYNEIIFPRQGINGGSCGYRYTRKTRNTPKNISDSAISQISVDCIEFSGFKYKVDSVSKVCCSGREHAKYISWLLLPEDSLEITVDILFDNDLYKKFWEFEDLTAIGIFDMCLYITNNKLICY